ncbi:MAG: glycosyltransferase [Desulfamplus sp.]|nr:glycosyltransferase [Desulfamplus sp.]
MNKKVALLCPDLRAGGAERMMLNLAEQIVLQNYQLDFLVVKLRGEYAKLVPDGVNIVELGGGRMLGALFPLMCYLKKHKPNWLLSTLFQANAAAILARILTASNVRVGIRIETNISAHLSQTRSPTLAMRILKIFIPYLYKRADVLIPISHGVEKDLAYRFGIPKKKMFPIYSPVLSPLFEANSKEYVDHPWFSDKQIPIILSAGRLSKAKDFSTLIKAFSLARQKLPMRLIILGEGEERIMLHDLARMSCYDSDIQLPGFHPNPSSFMSRCAVFILSSRWEGFGNVLVEALAAGAKVISTDCPSGPREILDNGRFGELVPVGDPISMADAILRVLSYKPSTLDSANGGELEEWLRQFRSEFSTVKYLSVLNGNS